jgi:hypothetical protein
MKPNLSVHPDLVLFLITEELKSRRLAHGLDRAGIDYSPFTRTRHRYSPGIWL